MTEFEKSVLTNMMNNGLNTAELTQFLAENKSVPAQQIVNTTPIQTSISLEAGTEHKYNETKGGESNVDLQQLMKMIEKQNETIQAIQMENMRQLANQKPPETMEDIVMNEFIKPIIERKQG